MEVIINESAFISMVTAAVETFPNETLGVLIGLRKAEKIVVQLAVAYQTARRTNDSVDVHPKLSNRMNFFLEKVTHLEVVGDFHSHPEAGVDRISSVKLSTADKNSMNVDNLGVVIAIDKDERKLEWRHLPKGSLKGSVHPYTLKVTTYFKTRENQYKIANNFCPFALGIGR